MHVGRGGNGYPPGQLFVGDQPVFVGDSPVIITVTES